MRESVLRKLGLAHTSVGIGPGLEKLAAPLYGNEGLPLPFFDTSHRGGGAIYSSADDLIRFGMFHLKAHLPDQTPILSDASIDEMQRPTFLSNPEFGTGYGVGWFNNDSFYGYRIVAHSGNMPGADTFLRLVPSERIAVAVLCNSIDCGAGRYGQNCRNPFAQMASAAAGESTRSPETIPATSGACRNMDGRGLDV